MSGGGDRRGAALAVAVFGLAVAGLVATLGLFAARVERRAAGELQFAVQAGAAADAGLAATLAGWDPVAFGTLMPLDEMILPAVQVGSTAEVYRARVQRLTGALFLVRSEGQRLDGAGSVLARQEVGQLVRVDLSAVREVAPIAERGWARIYH